MGSQSRTRPSNWTESFVFSLEKTLLLEKFECKRRRGQQRMRQLDSITNSMDMNLSKHWEVAEIPILWPPVAENWLIGKYPVAGKDWMQEEKGTTEDEVVGWHHQLDGRESEQAPGVCDGQGNLMFCSQCGCKVGRNWETKLNWTGKKWRTGMTMGSHRVGHDFVTKQQQILAWNFYFFYYLIKTCYDHLSPNYVN